MGRRWALGAVHSLVCVEDGTLLAGVRQNEVAVRSTRNAWLDLVPDRENDGMKAAKKGSRL